MPDLPGETLRIDLRCSDVVPYDFRTDLQRAVYASLNGSLIGELIHNHSACRRYGLVSFALLPRRPAVWSTDGIAGDGGLWRLHIASAYREALALIETRWPQKARIAGKTLIRRRIAREPLDAAAADLYVHALFVAARDRRRSLTPDDPEYGAAIVTGLVNRYAQWLGRDPDPGLAGSVRFSFAGPPRRRLVQYRDRSLLSFSGPVRLDAPPDMIRFARCVGLGQKQGAGLGALLPYCSVDAAAEVSCR